MYVAVTRRRSQPWPVAATVAAVRPVPVAPCRRNPPPCAAAARRRHRRPTPPL